MFCADRRESLVYVVGPKGAGKSTLIGKYLRPTSDAKSGSELVDYSYARKASSTAEGKHDVSSIWELPGAEKLAQALATKEKVWARLSMFTCLHNSISQTATDALQI